MIRESEFSLPIYTHPYSTAVISRELLDAWYFQGVFGKKIYCLALDMKGSPLGKYCWKDQKAL